MLFSEHATTAGTFTLSSRKGRATFLARVFTAGNQNKLQATCLGRLFADRFPATRHQSRRLLNQSEKPQNMARDFPSFCRHVQVDSSKRFKEAAPELQGRPAKAGCVDSVAGSVTARNWWGSPPGPKLQAGKQRYLCPECGYGTAFHRIFECYKRIHTGKHHFQCSNCNKAFAQKSYLTTHLRIHTGEKPHQCS